MIATLRTGLVAATLLTLTVSASAAIATSVGQVASLRIEGMAGFIGLSNSMASSSTCGTRVWVDMNTALGRSVYATALMAYTLKQNVIVRAFEESQRIFGECNLYDIYVYQ